jgi:hypothetical protein
MRQNEEKEWGSPILEDNQTNAKKKIGEGRERGEKLSTER